MESRWASQFVAGFHEGVCQIRMIPDLVRESIRYGKESVIWRERSSINAADKTVGNSTREFESICIPNAEFPVATGRNQLPIVAPGQ